MGGGAIKGRVILGKGSLGSLWGEGPLRGGEGIIGVIMGEGAILFVETLDI